MKKIAIFHNLPGGGGIRMLNEIIESYSSKCEIDLYTLGSQNSSNVYKKVKVFDFKVIPWNGFIPRLLWIVFILPKYHEKLASLIDSKKYDFVFLTHDYFTKSPYLLRYLRTKKVYLCQEPQREFYEPSWIHAPKIKQKIANFIRLPIKYIDLINVRYADKVYSNSKFSKKNIDKIYKIKSNIVYPGVDTEYFRPQKEINKNNQILSIGSLNIIKGHDFIVNSLESILNQYTLVIIGNGSNNDKKRIIGNNKKIKVIFLQNLKDEEILKYYQQSKLVCVASYLEPFGLTSIEAQSCGTPVICIDDGGTKETIINGITGLVSKRDRGVFLKNSLELLNKTSNIYKLCRENAIKNWQWKKTLKILDKDFL